MLTINLAFGGYYINKSFVPSRAGVYLVYAGSHDRGTDTVFIRKLVYTGESSDAHERLASHEKEAEWRRHLEPGEILIFSFAPITTSRVRAEAAVIYEHKPPCNTEYKYSFPFPATQISCTGRHLHVKSNFVVQGYRAASWY